MHDDAHGKPSEKVINLKASDTHKNQMVVESHLMKTHNHDSPLTLSKTDQARRACTEYAKKPKRMTCMYTGKRQIRQQNAGKGKSGRNKTSLLPQTHPDSESTDSLNESPTRQPPSINSTPTTSPLRHSSSSNINYCKCHMGLARKESSQFIAYSPLCILLLET